MDNLLFLLAATLITLGFFVYFRIARRFRIVDLPNHRTMHKGATIRGGGIVILVAMLIYTLLIDNPGNFFVIGLAIIGTLGFADDLLDLPGRMRLPLQILSVIFMVLALRLNEEVPLFWLFTIVLVATGVLNAYNFMDGINGMTSGYSLMAIITLAFINAKIYPFVSGEFLLFFGLSVVIFNFFNFRKKAACFAGDVGSFTIAYIIVYLIMKLIQYSGQPAFILLLTFYGIDTIFTIIERLAQKQNIFKAHRMHLFQVAISMTGIPHLRMSGIYIMGQFIVNIFVLMVIGFSWQMQLTLIVSMLVILSVMYIVLKYKLKTTAQNV